MWPGTYSHGSRSADGRTDENEIHLHLFSSLGRICFRVSSCYVTLYRVRRRRRRRTTKTFYFYTFFLLPRACERGRGDAGRWVGWAQDRSAPSLSPSPSLGHELSNMWSQRALSLSIFLLPRSHSAGGRPRVIRFGWGNVSL